MTFTGLHGVMSQKTENVMNSAARTTNPTHGILDSNLPEILPVLYASRKKGHGKT
jgi:hypothetical protein